MAKKVDVKKFISKYGGQYYDIQTARLGRLDGSTVLTDTDGVLWARQWNGKEIQVYNKALIAGDFDTRVLVGKDRNQRSKWYILQGLEDYLVPASGGRVAYHALQHQFGNPDVLWVDRKQLMAFSVVVSNALLWKVYLYGGMFQSLTQMTLVTSRELDLSAYASPTGAYYVSIIVDDLGNVTTQAGTNFGAPGAGGPAYVVIPSGEYLIAYVLFHEGQAQLSDSDIRVLTPLGVIPKPGGLQIHEADTDIPLDDDELGFWDVVDNLIKKITWRNLLFAIEAWISPSIHSHGIARWNGSSGQTTFELPDVAESISAVQLNGVLEDPLEYSLSTDGMQIVLNTALPAAYTVTAEYQPRKL